MVDEVMEVEEEEEEEEEEETVPGPERDNVGEYNNIMYMTDR